MKKLLLMSASLMFLFGLSAEEKFENQQCHCKEKCCEDDCICGDQCDCKEKPTYRIRHRNYDNRLDRSERSSWPGKMEDSFMEDMTGSPYY